MEILGLSPYPGRMILDHLPKTAGTAINAWLRSVLGDGCVTENLIGNHRELISRYGGSFSVISGHVHFDRAEGLDPRYQYATVLRDPIDRAISWLFFVTENHRPDDLPELFTDCQRFIATEGDEVTPSLFQAISNYYTEHFCRILGHGNEAPSTRLSNALEALELYQVVGVHEDLADCLENLGNLIGIPAPANLERVNVTTFRPTVADISAKLRERIAELNSLDIQLYEAAHRLIARRLVTHPPAPTTSRWLPMGSRQPTTLTGHALRILQADMLTPSAINAGDVMTFSVEVELNRPIGLLCAGIHIFDDQWRWAFGVNNALLNQDIRNLQPGHHQLTFHVVAQLPVGKFTAGCAFVDLTQECPETLFWHDALFAFEVGISGKNPGIGYARCPVRLTIWRKRQTVQLARPKAT
ncbi:MAG TPA: Wzt carbohydrate-binding domain-containing protein [Anaerolineales bacterium]|nr:Wzt carbohydrate-binding domain-containing protein [Anaerolineales bacterium]